MESVDSLRDEVLDQGFCILGNVIPSDRVDRVRDGVLQAAASHNRTDAPANRGAVSGLINHTQGFAPYLADARLTGLTETLLGRPVRVSFTSTIISYPGAERLQWHADWPFNQNNAGHIPAPYLDAVVHLTSIWMLSDFTVANGATLIVPGSHRQPNNPTGGNGVPMFESHPDEIHVEGKAGTVMVMDSRMWHATPRNDSDEIRVGLAIRWAPWWLNLDVLMPASDDRDRLLEVTGGKENQVPLVEPEVFAALPADVQPLFRHWLRGGGNWPGA